LINEGRVPEDDARTSFNLGLGMLAVVEPAQADGVARALGAAGERVWPIGEIVAGERGVEWLAT
jgi:phosphoribosylformylglycinamidine cyclo-ligase